MAELPDLAELRKKHPEVTFIGLLEDSTDPSVQTLILNSAIKIGLSHQYYLQEARSIRVKLGLDASLPAFALFDSEGYYTGSHISGSIHDQQVGEELDSLLVSIASSRGKVLLN
jgi:hypothetical protein